MPSLNRGRSRFIRCTSYTRARHCTRGIGVIEYPRIFADPLYPRIAIVTWRDRPPRLSSARVRESYKNYLYFACLLCTRVKWSNKLYILIYKYIELFIYTTGTLVRITARSRVIKYPAWAVIQSLAALPRGAISCVSGADKRGEGEIPVQGSRGPNRSVTREVSLSVPATRRTGTACGADPGIERKHLATCAGKSSWWP